MTPEEEDWALIVENEWMDLGVIIAQCGKDNVTWKADELEMDPVVYHVLGVAGEAGEVANAFKKLARPGIDKNAQWMQVREEMADTLTHLCALSALLGLDLAGAFWEKRQINMERFGNTNADSSDQSTLATEVRKHQQGSSGAAAFVCESDLQGPVHEETVRE